MKIEIPREKTEFATAEGLLSFCYLHAGQAQPSFNAGSFAYKTEIGIRPQDIKPNDAMVAAISLVAQTHDPANWEKHIYGPKGKLRFIQETDREVGKYSYYDGMLIATFSAVWNAKTLGFKDGIDLSQPAERSRFDQALNARAPGAYRYANMASQADIQKIEQMNQERLIKGVSIIPEADYYKTLLPVAAHEIWAGCYGRISGRAYWSENSKPAKVNLALTHVLLTRQGDRLVGGESSPDASFGAFAPSADLAPTGFSVPTPPAPPAVPGAPVDPWAGLV